MYETTAITREDGLELGTITVVPNKIGCSHAYFGSGTWMAVSTNGGTKYFVHHANAVKWLERKSKNIYPISRLAEFVNR